MRTWFTLLALLACLLCSEQQYKADEQQHTGNSFVQTGNSGKPSPSPNGKSVVPPHQIESSREENRTYEQKPQTDWCELFVKALFDNWPIIIIGIVGVCVATKTLKALVVQIKEMNRQTVATRIAAEAARDSVLLQHAAMQQWIDIKNWKAWFPDDTKKSLNVEFNIVNPTNFPLTVNEFEVVFLLPGVAPKEPLPQNFRLTPGNPQTVLTNIPITDKEAEIFQSAMPLMINVRITSVYTDMGPNGLTWMQAEGCLASHHGSRNMEAGFIPIMKKAQKAHQKT